MTQREENLSRSVREVQTALELLSRQDPTIPRVLPDGRFGPATTEAVRAFQRKIGFPETGTVDLATWSALFAAQRAAGRAMSPPRSISPYSTLVGVVADSEADAILLLQVLLRAIKTGADDEMPVPLNGKLDTPTMDAIRALQSAQGLPITGLPDRATWDALADTYDRLREREG